MAAGEPDSREEILRKAERAKRILYLCMVVFMALPFILAWFTGKIRF